MADAPILGGTKKVALDDVAFGARFNGPLVHESVRAELNARRQGTASTKTRGKVRGGGSKPWRQKGTGRARAGTIRAPQFTGGGVAFPPTARSFEVKVNRKARRSALRSALSAHAAAGTLGILRDDAFEAPSTKRAAELLTGWGNPYPVVVVAQPDQDRLLKSFRNLERVAVTTPGELEVAAVVWARSLLVTEAALHDVQRRAT